MMGTVTRIPQNLVFTYNKTILYKLLRYLLCPSLTECGFDKRDNIGTIWKFLNTLGTELTSTITWL